MLINNSPFKFLSVPIRQFIVFFCLALSGSLYANEAPDLEKVSLQLRWFHQFQFAGYYAAQEKGYFSEEGLEVEFREFNTQRNVDDQVISGEAEYGIMDSSLIQNYANGEPVIALAAIFQHDPLIFFAKKSSGIVSPYEMRNKRIMFQYFGARDVALNAILLEASIGADDFTHVPHSYNYNDLINGNVDVISGYLTDQLYFFQQQGVEVNVIKPLNYGIDFYGDILFTTRDELNSHPERVAAFRRAVIKGWHYALDHTEEMIQLIKNKYQSRLSLEHLRFEAEQTRKLIVPDLIPIGEMNYKRLIRAHEAYQQVGLVGPLSQKQLKDFIYKDRSRYELSEEEKQWLAEHPTIRVGIDRDFAPFEWVDSNGTYQGVVADYLDLLENKLGINFEIIKNKSWKQTLEMARQGELDMLSDANLTPERDEYLDFTEVYINSPVVIISDSSKGYIGNLKNLQGKKVAIESGYFMQEILQRDYPAIQLIESENEIEALHLVNNGEADAYVGDGISLNYFIQQQGLLNLRHSGNTPYSSQHRMAVTLQNPELLSILDKCLALLSDEEKKAIHDRWLRLTITQGVSKQTLLIYSIIGLAVFALLIFYTLKLRASERARTESEQKLHDILSNINVFIYLKGLDGKYLYANKQVCDLLGTSLERIVGTDVGQFFDKESAKNIRKNDLKVLESGEAVTSQDTHSVSETGHTATYLSTKLPLRNQDGKVYGLLGVSTDITESIESERREKARNRILEMLARDYELKQVLDQLVADLENEFPNFMASILLVNEVDNTFSLISAPSLPGFYNQAVDGIIIEPWIGSCGNAACTGERVIAADIQTNELWEPFKELTQQARLGSCWSEPIKSSSEQVIGTFAVYTAGVYQPSEREIDSVEQLANLAGIAIEKSQYQDDLETQKKLLEESNQQLKYVLNATYEGVWDWNLVTNRIKHNQQWSTLMGKTSHVAEENYDEDFNDILPEDREKVKQALQTSIQSNTPFISEHRRVKPDGEIIWVLTRAQVVEWNEEGQASRMVGATGDITARKNVESEIVEKEQLLRSSIEAMGEAFVIFDTEDRLVYCNEQYKSVYYLASTAVVQVGVTFREILEFGCAQGLYVDAIGCEQEWIEKRLDIHRQDSSDLIQQLSDGRWLNVRESKTPNGYIVGFRIDITEFILARQKADEANQAKGRFLATMSHEIRTPMNAVLGMAQLLEDTSLDEDQKSYLDMIHRSGKNLLRIINDILDFSKLDADMVTIDKVQFDLLDICLESLDVIENLIANRAIDLKFDNLLGDQTHFIGDPVRLNQVILNLLNNAIKFTPKGEVKLIVQSNAQSQTIKNIELFVCDNGVGIADENIDKLFDEFTQADEAATRAYDGTGLGLSICKKIIEKMDGTISVKSKAGEGSEFKVTLPLQVSSDYNATNETSLNNPGKLHNKKLNAKILLVEDLLPNQIIAKKFLLDIDCEVELCYDGKQAVEKWEKEKFDLIFMDCRMPVMDGYEATKKIRAIEQQQNKKSIPIIALTANASVEDRQLCEQVGMNDIITKPFERADLYRVISHWVDDKSISDIT